MNCNCIKGYYNCLIDSKPDNMIVYTDASLWNNKDIVSYEVSVFSLETGAVKYYEVSNEGISHLDDFFIKDDIYNFKVENCNSSYNVYKFIYPGIQCIMDNLLLHDNYECFLKIKKNVDYVIANVENDNVDTAKFYFDKIKKDIENLECKDCHKCY